MTWLPRDVHKISGFIAQYKYDDWRTLIYFLPNGEIRFYSRKKARLPRYKPPVAMMASLKKLKLAPNRLHVLDGGLLHYKTSRIKNTLVIWDVLVQDGNYLAGTTYRDRYALLQKICENPKEAAFLSYPDEKTGKIKRLSVGLKIAPHLWLAPQLKGDFKKIFDRTVPFEELEGLVLKDPNARLERAFHRDENARWQIRARKPRIDYAF